MRISSRRPAIAFFVVLGVCLVLLAIGLNVGWIILNWREGVLLFLGVIFFALLIAGGLAFAVPLCVVTANRAVGRALLRAGLGRLPEETTPSPLDALALPAVEMMGRKVESRSHEKTRYPRAISTE